VAGLFPDERLFGGPAFPTAALGGAPGVYSSRYAGTDGYDAANNAKLLAELAAVADEVRRNVVPDPNVVTWQIDRNVNITNVCISGCKFCNFHCKPHETERAFITTVDEYRAKIDRMLELGGDQLLLQGGLHPKLGIEFYEDLFSTLKRLYPSVRLHALGAPEVSHIARVSGLTTRRALERLVAAGLD